MRWRVTQCVDMPSNDEERSGADAGLSSLANGRLLILAQVLQCQAVGFNVQYIATTVWGFAKTEQFDGRLFAISAQAVKRKVDGFNAQDIASPA